MEEVGKTWHRILGTDKVGTRTTVARLGWHASERQSTGTTKKLVACAAYADLAYTRFGIKLVTPSTHL